MMCLIAGNVCFAEDMNLDKDTTLSADSGTIVTNKNINTNGHTLTVQGKGTGSGVSGNGGSVTIRGGGTLNIDNVQFGVHISAGSGKKKVDIDVDNMSISNVKVHGIYANTDTINVNVSKSLMMQDIGDGGFTATGDKNYRGTLNVTAGSIYVAADSYGAKVGSGGLMNLSTANGGDITLNSKYAVLIEEDGERHKNEMKISSDGSVNLIGKSYGVFTKTPIESLLSPSHNYSLDIDAKKAVTINGKTAIFVSGAKEGTNSNVDIDAGEKIEISSTSTSATKTAIDAKRGVIVNINQKNQSGTNPDVVVNGDVKADGTKGYEVTKVNIDFTTAESVLNGKITTGTANAETNMVFANGATWNNNGKSNVTNLNMDGGVINQDGIGDHTISVDNYAGSGKINFAVDGVGADGNLNITSGGLNITNAKEGSVINVGAKGDKVDTFDLSKAQSTLEELANKIKFDGADSNLTGTVKLDEGLITSEASADMKFDQSDNLGHIDMDSIDVGSKETATMRAMRDIASTAIVAWRQEDSTLSQRLGELRNSEGDQGIWTRMSRGEFEYDGAYENQYNFFQLGYDKAYGDWHYGAAISHNDGKTTYAEGSGENRSTSLSLYGTWLGDKGHYADVVLKQGRLSNEFDTYAAAGHTHGDYDAWGTSLSGEYGRKTELNDGWYVTPQVQLTLMRIGSESYTTDNGISVDQETLNSAVGRIGLEFGKVVNDKGAVYAKASMLHEFAGNADTYLNLNGIRNSYSQDIGGTWYEAGIGLNYRTSNDSYIYADVVKTFGGDVETPWQWNVGMRWGF